MCVCGSGGAVTTGAVIEIWIVVRVNRDEVIAGIASMSLSYLLQWGTSTPFACDSPIRWQIVNTDSTSQIWNP
jgi:hypothetical protein